MVLTQPCGMVGRIHQVIMSKLKNIAASNFASKVIETFGVRIFLIVLGLFITVIVARILGPEGRGIFAVATSITMIGVQFGNLGLHAANTFYVAKDESILSTILGNSLFLSFFVVTIIVSILYLFFIFYPSFSPLHDNKILFISLISIPIALSYLLLSNILIGLHKIREYNTLEIINKIAILFATAFIFLFAHITIEYFLLAILSGNVAALLVAKIIYQKSVQKITYSFTLFKEHIHYGFKAYLAAFFAFMVIRSDILMVDYYLGAKEAGYYSIASSMAEMVYLLPTIIGMLLTPKIIQTDGYEAKLRIVKKIAWMTTGMMLLFCLLSALIAEFMVKLLFGEVFMPSVYPFIWLMPGIIFLSINTIFQNYFAAIGMPVVVIYTPLIALIANITMNKYLISSIGISGASMSSSISYGIMLIISLAYIKRKKNVK